jgi:hypothetical protein
MAKLIYVSREEVEKGRVEMEELLAEDEFWQEEHEKMKQFDEEEKFRRDTEYAEREKSELVDKEAPK